MKSMLIAVALILTSTVTSAYSEPLEKDAKGAKAASTIVQNPPSCTAYRQQWVRYGAHPQHVACQISCPYEQKAVCRSTDSESPGSASCKCEK